MNKLDIYGIFWWRLYIYFNDVISKNIFWNIHVEMTLGSIYKSHKEFSLIPFYFFIINPLIFFAYRALSIFFISKTAQLLKKLNHQI